jgi:predicted ABC-type ATPase
LDWFNPDTYTRLYQRESSLSLEEANAMAWEEGRRRLGIAIDQGLRHAFETTLGGQTITQMLEQASKTHDVDVWYCGLSSLDLHLERVKQRVAAGGHDIDPAKIAQRYIDSPFNLVRLMPFLSKLVVYDNSASVGAGEVMPNPARVLAVVSQRVLYPSTPESLARTPVWARPLVERALQIQDNAQQLCR